MDNTFNLRIFQTSDIHGYVVSQNYSTKQKEHLGLAKISTLIKKRKTDNTIIIDSGDTIQGSPLDYYIATQKYQVHPLAHIINKIGYDYVTIGNHEFNFGLELLASYLDNLDAKILNCNIIETHTNKPLYGMPYEIKQFESGPKIGIIGATTHYIPNWENPNHIKNISFIDAKEALQKTVKLIKNKVDYLIVNYHGGFERDLENGNLLMEDTGENQGYKILSEIDGIDLFLTGHQHRVLYGKMNKTYYTQPGFNANHLAEINVSFQKKDGIFNHETNITMHDLVNIKEDNEIIKLINDIEIKTQTYLDKPIGKLPFDLLVEDPLSVRIKPHPLVSFIHQVQLHETNAQISMVSLANDVTGLKQNVTFRDILSTYPFPNTLVVKELTGAVIIKALEKSALFFTKQNEKITISESFSSPKKQFYAYDMFYPIEYTIDVSKPKNNRINDVYFNGKKLNLNQTYTVVMNNYRASGGGDFYFIKNAKTIKNTQKEVIEVLINYIQNNIQITINHLDNFRVI